MDEEIKQSIKEYAGLVKEIVAELYAVDSGNANMCDVNIICAVLEEIGRDRRQRAIGRRKRG